MRNFEAQPACADNRVTSQRDEIQPLLMECDRNQANIEQGDVAEESAWIIVAQIKAGR